MTIVAAWMRAETGVGPAMASPSQAWRGNCADFPQAPTRRRTPTAVRTAVEAPEASGRTLSKSTDPKWATIAIMARMRPTSPTRFITKAFLPAAALAGT